ncbi:MAG: hypothetical protein KBS77_03830 [Bacteroidales bacterium]|nr:hypothetical protein [Candidatus Colicola faecequi]
MKKIIFLVVFALCALMMCLPSCTNDEPLQPSDLTIAGTWHLVVDFRGDVQDKDITYTFGPGHTLTIAHAWTQTNPDTTLILSYELSGTDPVAISMSGVQGKIPGNNWFVGLSGDSMMWIEHYTENLSDVPFTGYGYGDHMYFVRVK